MGGFFFRPPEKEKKEDEEKKLERNGSVFSTCCYAIKHF